MTVTSPCLLLFVPNRLCTLMPLNTHLLVERMYRVENTGVCPGAASTVTKSELGTWRVKYPNDDVAVIAAHQLDRVAGLDGRVADLVRNDDALAVDDVEVGNARQQRACVASDVEAPLNHHWLLITALRLFQGCAWEPSPPSAGVLPLTGSTHQTLPVGPG